MIKLVPFEEKHLEATLLWVNNPQIMQYINRVLPVTWYQHNEWYHRIITDQSQIIFAVEENGVHVGNCGLKDIDTRSHKAELWIYFDGEKVGNGLGIDALKELLRFGFDSINLNRIYLYTLEYNDRAIKAFSKAGLNIEGILKEDTFINGEYINSVRMAVLKSEYQKRSKENGR